jgi:CHASE2 domain-containing sensor protein
MSQRLKKAAAIAAIAIASVAATIGLSQLRFFQLLNLKAQDVHFVLRGTLPVKDIVIIGVDDDTLSRFPEPTFF